MSKHDEINYIKNIGPDGAQHAYHKPYSDATCGHYLTDIGTIFMLLPNLPARLLDLGGGTAWTSVMFAKRGYDVVAQDISPDMIELAHKNRDDSRLENISLIVSDYESLDFKDEFDCAVFYDSLHHAVDELAAIRSVFLALKPGGICITAEPGAGHSNAEATRNAVRTFGVTEKDMPPHHIIKVALMAGFTSAKVYHRCFAPQQLFDSSDYRPFKASRFRKAMSGLKQAAKTIFQIARSPGNVPADLATGNIVVLIK
jgi:ubiquinone/menaquinone biosynthesis C-methylase UbiE